MQELKLEEEEGPDFSRLQEEHTKVRTILIHQGFFVCDIELAP